MSHKSIRAYCCWIPGTFEAQRTKRMLWWAAAIDGLHEASSTIGHPILSFSTGCIVAHPNHPNPTHTLVMNNACAFYGRVYIMHSIAVQAKQMSVWYALNTIGNAPLNRLLLPPNQTYTAPRPKSTRTLSVKSNTHTPTEHIHIPTHHTLSTICYKLYGVRFSHTHDESHLDIKWWCCGRARGSLLEI